RPPAPPPLLPGRPGGGAQGGGSGGEPGRAQALTDSLIDRRFAANPAPGARLESARCPGVGRERPMKWVNVYLVGYVIFIIGVIAALAEAGVIEKSGAGWPAVGVVIATGLGVMFSISASGRKATFEVTRR